MKVKAENDEKVNGFQRNTLKLITRQLGCELYVVTELLELTKYIEN